MRKLVVTENITLDGVIDMDGEWFAPANKGQGFEDLIEELSDQREQADTLLLGRVSFEQMRGYWPRQTDDTSGTATYLDRVDKIVVSSTLAEPAWANTTVVGSPLRPVLKDLKARSGKNIVATGSVTLVHALAGEGLVDEYRLFVYPVVTGSGRRLFPSGSAASLRLIDERRFMSGVVLLSYSTS